MPGSLSGRHVAFPSAALPASGSMGIISARIFEAPLFSFEKPQGSTDGWIKKGFPKFDVSALDVGCWLLAFGGYWLITGVLSAKSQGPIAKS